MSGKNGIPPPNIFAWPVMFIYHLSISFVPTMLSYSPGVKMVLLSWMVIIISKFLHRPRVYSACIHKYWVQGTELIVADRSILGSMHGIYSPITGLVWLCRTSVAQLFLAYILVSLKVFLSRGSVLDSLWLCWPINFSAKLEWNFSLRSFICSFWGFHL